MTLEHARELVEEAWSYPIIGRQEVLAELLVSETAKARHQAFTEAAQIAQNSHDVYSEPVCQQAILLARDRV